MLQVYNIVTDVICRACAGMPGMLLGVFMLDILLNTAVIVWQYFYLYSIFMIVFIVDHLENDVTGWHQARIRSSQSTAAIDCCSTFFRGCHPGDNCCGLSCFLVPGDWWQLLIAFWSCSSYWSWCIAIKAVTWCILREGSCKLDGLRILINIFGILFLICFVKCVLVTHIICFC